MEEVVEWLCGVGGKVSPNIKVEFSPERGNHITGTPRPNELLVQVPSSQLVNVKTLGVAEHSHTNLAKYLYSTENPWTRSIPAIELPLCWSDADILRLPLSYQHKIQNQRLQVNQSFNELGISDYPRWVWAWSSVNSRCLYWDVGLERQDQMTLAPLIDFFNHSTNPAECITIKNQLGKMCAYAPHDPTSELNLFYGPHENAFLLVEYGFVPVDNRYNHIDISEQIKSLGLNRPALEQLGYWDQYTLNMEGPCYRTLIALASIECTPKQLERYSNGIDEIPSMRKYTDPLVMQLMEQYTILPSDRPEIKALYREYEKILSMCV